MARPKNPRGGRPPISAEKWNEVVALIEQKKSPAEIIELTGLSQTKVYEIQRNPVRRVAEAA